MSAVDLARMVSVKRLLGLNLMNRFSFHLDESVALMSSLFVIQKAVLKKTSPEIHPVNLHCATSTETIHTWRFDSGLVLDLSSSEHSTGIQKAVL